MPDPLSRTEIEDFKNHRMTLTAFRRVNWEEVAFRAFENIDLMDKELTRQIEVLAELRARVASVIPKIDRVLEGNE